MKAHLSTAWWTSRHCREVGQLQSRKASDMRNIGIAYLFIAFDHAAGIQLRQCPLLGNTVGGTMSIPGAGVGDEGDDGDGRDDKNRKVEGAE
jgi:hypothetical protein